MYTYGGMYTRLLCWVLCGQVGVEDYVQEEKREKQ